MKQRAKIAGSIYWFSRSGKDFCRAARVVRGRRFVADCLSEFAGTKAAMSAAEIRAAENSAATRLADKIDAHAPNAENFTLVQWIEQSISEKEENRAIEETTAIAYRSCLRNYIAADDFSIGAVLLTKVTSQQCRDHFKLLRDRKTSSSNQRATYTLMNWCFKRALTHLDLKDNPLRAVERPRHTVKHRTHFSSVHLAAIVDALVGHPFEALFWIAMTRGYRLSEIMGLRWRDFDASAGTLHIASQIYYPRGRGRGPVHKDLKSEESESTFIQNPYVLSLLRAMKRRADSAPIFANTEGGALQPSNFRMRAWYPLLAAAGLPRTPFHRFRNTALSTILTALPGDLLTAQHLARHKTFSQTAEYVGQNRTIGAEKLAAADSELRLKINRGRQ